MSLVPKKNSKTATRANNQFQFTPQGKLQGFNVERAPSIASFDSESGMQSYALDVKLTFALRREDLIIFMHEITFINGVETEREGDGKGEKSKVK